MGFTIPLKFGKAYFYSINDLPYNLSMKFFTPDIKSHIISIRAKSDFKINFSK